jgi:hypothetical protein
VTVRQTQPAKKKKQRKALQSARPLDAMVLRTLNLFMRTLIRCGYSSAEVMRQCEEFGRQIESRAQRAEVAGDARQDDWFQIMTLWSMDPEYVDEEGQPLALRIQGNAPSVEALLSRVGSRLPLKEACNQLLTTGVAKRVNRRLVAIAHAPIVFPAGSAEQGAHHLQLLHSVLLNIEHNTAPPDGSRWVERQAICHNFPESALAAYSEATSERAQNFLEQEDATMHRIATFTPSNGRYLRATVQILFSARETDSVSNASDSSGSLGRNKPVKPRARKRSDRKTDQ